MRMRPTRCSALRRRTRIERAMTLGWTCVLALSSTSIALGQTIRVAVIHEPRQDEAARRVRAEVSAAGFDALDVPVPATEPRSTERLAHAMRAVAALRIFASGELELLVIDAETGEVLAREALEGASSEPAVRAVEDLRAKLIELDISPPEESLRAELQTDATPKSSAVSLEKQNLPQPATTPAIKKKIANPLATRSEDAHRDARGLWLQAAVAGSASAGGLTSDFSSRLGVRFEPSPRWSISGLAILPLTSQRVSSDRGRADVQVRIFGASLALVPLRVNQLEFGLGLGAGVVWANVEGFPASAMDQGRTVSVWAGSGFGELTLAWQPASWMRLRATALAGSAFPRPSIHFDGNSVANWGRPFALGSFGIEVLPWSAGRAP